MRGRFKVALSIALAGSVLPLAWQQMTPADRTHVHGLVGGARAAIREVLGTPGAPTPVGRDAPGERLIEPGLWSFVASFTADGHVTNTAGTRCLTDRDVDEVLTRSAQAIFAGGWNCRLEQHMEEGRRLVGGGVCEGLAAMRLDVEVDMDTPHHLSAVVVQTTLGKGRVNQYAQEEGTWTGPCP